MIDTDGLLFARTNNQIYIWNIYLQSKNGRELYTITNLSGAVRSTYIKETVLDNLDSRLWEEGGKLLFWQFIFSLDVPDNNVSIVMSMIEKLFSVKS